MVEKPAVNRCPKCAAEVVPSNGPGRPATYCSPACRRAAEFELRRAQRRLERAEHDLETRRRHFEALDAGVVYSTSASMNRARLEFEQAQRLVAELEERMLELLSGGANVLAS